MAHVLKSFIGFLVIIHIVTLFFVVGQKEKLRVFAEKLNPNKNPIIASAEGKPRIPFRILSPFAGDLFFTVGERPAFVPLEANFSAIWQVNGQPAGEGKQMLWKGPAGDHQVRATYQGESRLVNITIK